MPKHFTTDTGIQVPAISTAQMREIDRIALEITGPNLFQMMENAGRNLAEQALKMTGTPAKIVVLAGTGGNGGGGICAARHLANHGAEVFLCLTNPDQLNAVPLFQRKVFSATRGLEIRQPHLRKIKPDLILDALIGYSLSGPPRGPARELIQWANATRQPVLALDVPSGLEATTGENPGEMIRAQHTLTLALPKTGLLPDKTGELLLADIGIPVSVYRKLELKFKSPFDGRYVVPLE